MDFDLVPLRGGSIAVRASGKIEEGDVGRLLSVLDAARPTESGWIPLLLSSGGGNVNAAFDLAEVIRDRKLMPVVMPGRTCESACSTILFLAGKRSLLTQNATLFFHSCISKARVFGAEQLCNERISRDMKEEHEITDEMLLFTLNAFVNDEEEIAREDRLINAPVAECLAIDRPPWTPNRPNPTRCGTGDLLERDPMIAEADTDTQTSREPEPVPGNVHPVWFLFHWTPPDQWAYWRIEDGVGLGLRPRGTFRNGPELRLSCDLKDLSKTTQHDLKLDLRLPASTNVAQVQAVHLQVGTDHRARIQTIDDFVEGPLVVAGDSATTRVVALFPEMVWSDLASLEADFSLKLVAQNGAMIWKRTYPSSGLAKRITQARSNCVGALQER